MKVRFEPQENVSGDPRLARQGFGRVCPEGAPAFDPGRDIDAACAYFEGHGFVVLAGCLDPTELLYLNAFCDRTQAERPDAWGLGERRKPHHINQGLIFSQPCSITPNSTPSLGALARSPSSPGSSAAKTTCGSRNSTFARRPGAPAQER
jgi:hypothetical protein